MFEFFFVTIQNALFLVVSQRSWQGAVQRGTYHSAKCSPSLPWELQRPQDHPGLLNQELWGESPAFYVNPL